MPRSYLGYLISTFCLLGLALLHAHFALHSQLGDWGGDNATYLIMAEHLRAPNAMTQYVVSRSIFPWGFPTLIAAVGGGVEQWWIGHVVVLASLIAALLLAWSWWRQAGWLAATSLVLVLGLLPGGVLLSTDILSENTFIALTLLTCLLADQARSRPWLWFGALAAALAALSTRSIGVALLPALGWGLVPALRQRQALARPAFVAVVLALVGWYLSNRGAGRYSHVGILNSGVDNVASLLGLLLQQVAALWRGWVDLWHPLGGNDVAAVLMLASAALGCGVRLVQWRSDAPYALAYLTIILLWPFPGEAARFLYGLYPILLWQAWCGVSWLIARIRLPAQWARCQPWLALVLPAALLLGVAPTAYTLLQHSLRTFPAPLQDYRGMAPVLRVADANIAQQVAADKHATSSAMRRVGALVPEGACIQAIKPSLVSLYAGRGARMPLPPTAPQEEFVATLPDCPYLLLLAYRHPMFPRMYPAFRLQGMNTRVLANLDDGPQRIGALLKVDQW